METALPSDTLDMASPGAGAGIPHEAPKNGGGWRHDIPYRWELTAYLSLFSVALVMRLYDLGTRAIHHDESLHGVFSYSLSQGDGYTHDPLMHGPFLFHSTAATFFLFGDSDATLRLVEVLFGSALVFIPLLLRPRLGNVSAFLVAVGLAFSPSLLYFSRFARNDIIMAVWTLALVGVIWRYMDEGRPRWLYFAAGLMALGFATKETQFLVVAILAVALMFVARGDVGLWLWGHKKFSQFTNKGSALLVIVILTAPLSGAMAGAFQGIFDITLAAREGEGLPTGSPDGVGLGIAIAISLILLAISIGVGFFWNRRLMWKVMAIFWVIFFLLYTTFGTHLEGFATGIWQSLGYWIGQQDVHRGDQPGYYYFILSAVYEFLPWVVAIGGSLYYIRKGDTFTRFLVFWAAATFAAYSLAGERMPWLMVNIALPLIVLAGKTLGDVLSALEWRRAIGAGAIYVFVGMPALVLLTWRIVFFDTSDADIGRLLELWGLLAIAAFMIFGFYLFIRRVGRKPAWSIAFAAIVLVMFGFTVRVGWLAAYVHSDEPKDMLIYTQTAPDIPQLIKEIEAAGVLTAKRHDISIVIDNKDGFAWPWFWYFRGYSDVLYKDLTSNVPIAGVKCNLDSSDASLLDALEIGQEIEVTGRFARYASNVTLDTCSINSANGERVQESVGETLSVSAGNLLSAFQDDDDAAEGTYSDSDVTVKGRILEIDRSSPIPGSVVISNGGVFDDKTIAIINAKNNQHYENVMAVDQFSDGRRFVHRWWFPERYRDVTVGNIFDTLRDRERWKTSVEFWLYRELPSTVAGVTSYIDGVDSYIYFGDEVPLRPLE